MQPQFFEQKIIHSHTCFFSPEELSKNTKEPTTYYETDLDTKVTIDLAVHFNLAFNSQENGAFQEDQPDFHEYIHPKPVPSSEGNDGYTTSNSVPDPIYAFNEEPLQAKTQFRQVYSKVNIDFFYINGCWKCITIFKSAGVVSW